MSRFRYDTREETGIESTLDSTILAKDRRSFVTYRICLTLSTFHLYYCYDYYFKVYQCCRCCYDVGFSFVDSQFYLFLPLRVSWRGRSSSDEKKIPRGGESADRGRLLLSPVSRRVVSLDRAERLENSSLESVSIALFSRHSSRGNGNVKVFFRPGNRACAVKMIVKEKKKKKRTCLIRTAAEPNRNDSHRASFYSRVNAARCVLDLSSKVRPLSVTPV